MRHNDLSYEGQRVFWAGRGHFKASSGLPGYQAPKHTCVPESGPIPEGFYKVFLADHGQAKDDGSGVCALRPSWGIQSIPRGTAAEKCEPYWANWGKTEREWNRLTI